MEEAESKPRLQAMKTIRAWCVSNFRYYVVFSKSILFILGLLFSYKLVDKLLFNILITYLSVDWNVYDMRKAAVIVNLQEGITSVLQIFFAFVADAYTGHFNMLVCSTTLHIIGLVLTYLAARNGEEFLDVKVFYVALLLLTLSKAAIEVTLQSFLGDQVVARDQPVTPEDEERAHRRSNFWWRVLTILSSIFVLFGPLNASLKMLGRVLAIATGVAFFWFLLGSKFYTRIPPSGSALSDVVRVIRTAILKRNIDYPQNPEQLSENSSGLIQILPHVSWLRWLDRAAVVVVPESPEACSVEQVKGVKFLLKMIPMWMTFLTFTVVAASGSTFFLEQVSSITDDTFAFLFFTNFQTLTGLVVSDVCDYALEKLVKKRNNIVQRMILVRIGMGMACSVLCCIAAWATARHQVPSHRSVYIIFTPQYLVLAFMEGFATEGLQNFFDSQAPESMSNYGPPFGEFVMGVGKIFSIICILILGGGFKWINKNVEDSWLDKYYALLAVLCSINFVVYCRIACWYGDDTFLMGVKRVDTEMGNLMPEQNSSGDGNLPELGNLMPEQSSSGDGNLPAGERTLHRPSNAPILHTRSFLRPTSRGVYKRIHSIN